MRTSFKNVFSGTSAKAIWAATRSVAFSAASPANSSPERKGVAFAMRVFKLAKT